MKYSIKLRNIISLFCTQHILVGVGEPRLSWSQKVEASQEMELEACKRERKEKCEQLIGAGQAGSRPRAH
jgi:hypothetical protein